MVVAPKLFINSVMEKVPPLPSYTTQTTLLMEGSYLRVGRHPEPISRTLKVSCLLYPIMASKIEENFQSLIRKRQVLDTFISDQHLEMSTKQVGMKGNPPRSKLRLENSSDLTTFRDTVSASRDTGSDTHFFNLNGRADFGSAYKRPAVNMNAINNGHMCVFDLEVYLLKGL